jgi:hypothetical protein
LAHDLEYLRNRLVDAGAEVRPDDLFPDFQRF